MCLLIGQQKNAKVSNKKLGNAWSKNDDGVGYAFVKDGQIKIKRFMEFKPFKREFNSDVKRYGSQSSFLIHFRFATHGKTDLTNVHPFRVNKNLVFGHNGVINSVDTDLKLSDTQVFNNVILKNLNPDFLNNDTLRFLVEEAIGSSKLAFLDSDGKIDILNEGLGHWSDDEKIWYSNDGYKKQSYYIQPSGNVYNAWNTGKFSLKNEKKNLAEDSFLKCDLCESQTDVTYTAGKKQYCDICISYAPNMK